MDQGRGGSGLNGPFNILRGHVEMGYRSDEGLPKGEHQDPLLPEGLHGAARVGLQLGYIENDDIGLHGMGIDPNPVDSRKPLG
jgi:hypothetical protein